MEKQYIDFIDEYQPLTFLQSPTAQFKENTNVSSSMELSVNQNCFLSITFTHHMLLLHKCKSPDERSFYIHHAATNFWSVSLRTKTRKIQSRICRPTQFLSQRPWR